MPLTHEYAFKHAKMHIRGLQAQVYRIKHGDANISTYFGIQRKDAACRPATICANPVTSHAPNTTGARVYTTSTN